MAAWFTKKTKVKTQAASSTRMEGLWTKCDSCGEIVYQQIEIRLGVVDEANYFSFEIAHGPPQIVQRFRTRCCGIVYLHACAFIV